MDNYDVVILGGGLAGLTSAVYLAQAGKSVAVIEKGKQFGGRATTKEIEGSYYNQGPHAFYKKGEAVLMLEEMGIQIEGGSPGLQGSVYYQDHQYDLPTNLWSVLKTKLLNKKEKKEFVNLMWNIGKIAPSKHYHQSLKEWADSTIISKKIQDLFYTYCRLASYLNAPELVNAGNVLNQLKISLSGAIYVNQGWQSIVDQLVEKATQLGVTLLNHQVVKELNMTQQTKIITVSDRKKEKQITAKWVISTLPPNEIQQTLKGVETSHFGDMLKQCIPAKAACLDITLNHLPDPKQNFSLDIDRSLYYSNHSKTAKLTHHPKHQVIHVMKYFRANETEAPENTLQILTSFLEKIQPQWQKYSVSQRFLPNIIVSHRLPVVGIESLMDVVEKEFPGLLLAGEWVSDEKLLAEAVFQTANKAAHQILRSNKS